MCCTVINGWTDLPALSRQLPILLQTTLQTRTETSRICLSRTGNGIGVLERPWLLALPIANGTFSSPLSKQVNSTVHLCLLPFLLKRASSLNAKVAGLKIPVVQAPHIRIPYVIITVVSSLPSTFGEIIIASRIFISLLTMAFLVDDIEYVIESIQPAFWEVTISAIQVHGEFTSLFFDQGSIERNVPESHVLDPLRKSSLYHLRVFSTAVALLICACNVTSMLRQSSAINSKLSCCFCHRHLRYVDIVIFWAPVTVGHWDGHWNPLKSEASPRKSEPFFSRVDLRWWRTTCPGWRMAKSSHVVFFCSKSGQMCFARLVWLV